MTQAKNQPKPTQARQLKRLDKSLTMALDEYFRQLKGTEVNQLHKLVFIRIEKVLFEYMLEREAYNQSRVCDILGISRSTLRAKIQRYGIKVPKR